jgi:hypothetical protein
MLKLKLKKKKKHIREVVMSKSSISFKKTVRTKPSSGPYKGGLPKPTPATNFQVVYILPCLLMRSCFTPWA